MAPAPPPPLQCGLALFPSSPYMHILYADYLISARKDGQGSRVQLTLAAAKHPSTIETWLIYTSQELTKTSKAAAASGLLNGYIEFQRNYK